MLAAAPLVLLIAIALVQIWLSAAIDLTPWKGGGFGMFSTVDHVPSRFIRVFLVLRGDGGQEVPISLPTERREIGELARAVRAAPGNTDVLHDLANRLRFVHWVDQDTSKLPPHPPDGGKPPTRLIAAATKTTQPGTPPVPFDALRVEVWKLRYDGDAHKLTTDLVAQTTVAGTIL